MALRRAALVPALAVGSLLSCATTSVQGLYCATRKGNELFAQCQSLVDTGNGFWVASSMGARLLKREQLPLHPPQEKDDRWRLGNDEGMPRVLDPFLDLTMAKLKGRHVFMRVDFEIGQPLPRPDKTLVVSDGVYIRADAYEEPSENCLAGVLVNDPTFFRTRVNPPQPAAPRPGTLGLRMFGVFELDHPPHLCPDALDPARHNPAHRLRAVASVYIRPDGSVEGLDLESGGFFVRVEATRAEIGHLVHTLHLDYLPPEDD